jgi:NAD+ diphosphatase
LRKGSTWRTTGADRLPSDAALIAKPANPPPHLYSSIGYDRAADRREDAAFQASALRDPGTAFLVLHGLKPLVTEDEAGPRALFVDQPRLAGFRPEEPVFLGFLAGRAVYAVDLDGAEIEGGTYLELRSVAAGLPPGEAGLLAFARALAHWRLRHRHCGACGSRMVTLLAGHCRRCEACGFDTFPRTDPAVICLVVSGEHCLLGRSRHFPEGMFSTLAGFVEPGESLEQTVVREIREEVGITVDAVRYRSSQPWPFPQSLMLGFRAEAPFVPPVVDPAELEDARWLHRRELLDPERRPLRLPNPDSIARYLIEEWLYAS